MFINRENYAAALKCEASYPEAGVGPFSFLSFSSDLRGVTIGAVEHIERAVGIRADVNRVSVGVR